MVKAKRREQQKSPLFRLAMEASPNQIVEIDQWAKANTTKYRILRILNAVRKKLEAKEVPLPSIQEQLTDLGFRLVENTFGIDNFNENALWQKRAKEAVKQTGTPVSTVRSIRLAAEPCQKRRSPSRQKAVAVT